MMSSLITGALAVAQCIVWGQTSAANSLAPASHDRLAAASHATGRAANSLAGLYLYIAHPGLKRFAAAYDETLKQDFIDGAAIVVEWRKIEPEPGVYDWSDLDRWLQPVLQRGKKLSVGIIAGSFSPEWIFHGTDAVTKNVFQQKSPGPGPACRTMLQPSIWEPAYLRDYGRVMASLARHLKQYQVGPGPSAYDALTVIKLSGINATTEEVRVLTGAVGVAACGEGEVTDIWQKAGYRPQKIVTAFLAIAARIGAIFPDKPLAAAVIHKFAFPPIDEHGQLDISARNPDPVTQAILDAAVPIYGSRLMIQWNALWQGAPPKEIGQAGKQGAIIGWQMNDFLGAWSGSGCIYPGWKIEGCRTAGDFQAILDNGMELGAQYIEVQVGSTINTSWRPAFRAAHANLVARNRE